MEYRYVAQFGYNNNIYNMYLDNNNKHFFLRVEDDNLSYVTIEELFDLVIKFNSIPNVMNAEKSTKKGMLKIIPKILIGGVAITLSATMLLTLYSVYQSKKNAEEFRKRHEVTSEYTSDDINNYVSTDNNQNEEPTDLVVDTYLDSDLLKYLYIYDNDYLDKALDYDNVSIDQVKDEIKNNSKIPDKFKKLMYEYCDALVEKYPDIELRIFYENIKTLEVTECTKKEMVMASLSIDAYGCYVRTENKIYVLEDEEFKKGTWAYQVIFHELSHCLRIGNWNKNGYKIKVQAEGQNFSNLITSEVLNSLFTVSLFDYDEKDIAYQLQSNYNKVMIECMDNYNVEDYVKHSVSYYAQKLDETNNEKNNATVILNLMQMQYDDFHDDSIKLNQEEYYPIYDYIAKMYYRKNINPNMSYSEATKVTDELLEKIMFDVPEEYEIDTNHFYDYLNEYCNSIGIDCEVKTK